MTTFQWGNGTLELTFAWDDDSPVSLAALRSNGLDVRFDHRLALAEILVTGTGHWLASDRLVHTDVGRALRYAGHAERVDPATGVRHLDVIMEDSTLGLRATVGYDLHDGTAMVRSTVTVTNIGHPTVTAGPDVNAGQSPALAADGSVTLESVTSWVSAFGAPAGKAAAADSWTLIECENDWLGEGRWHGTATRELFPTLNQQMTRHNPRGEHRVVSTGTWSTGKHTPLAILDSRELGLTWLFQVEHNAAWRWDIGRDTEDGYIALSGPTCVNHDWSATLAPGESFTTVPAAITAAHDFDGVIANVTDYRRAARVRKGNDVPPLVIFNDYMNTIDGDPTTDKLLPLVKGAAEAGAEVFCIDAGWYDDTGDWWPSVGAWEPSTTRFPNGINEVLDAIRDAGMIPGLWLEPEVIGVKSPVATSLPESAFFHRHGHRVVEQERYLLDLRDPDARRHLDDTVDRLINDLGAGYFKFDYNVSPDSGTDLNADSAGAGLLGHNRAYADWVEGLHRRHPELILENCSSGGMRMDFAQTSRFQVQSTSDQQDFRLYPTIAATAPMLMTPEQAGSWAYPNASMNAEEFAFATATTFLGRFFLSGYLNRMSSEQRALVAQAIAAYKAQVRPSIGHAMPFWPLGLPGWNDGVVATGLRFVTNPDEATESGENGPEAADDALVTVWSRGGDAPEGESFDFSGFPEGKAALKLPWLAGRKVSVETIFPLSDPDGFRFEPWKTSWNADDATLEVTPLAGVHTARVLRIHATDR